MRAATEQKTIRKWREKEGLTQDEVSDLIGDPARQFRRWECGLCKTLPLRMKVRLAQKSGIPLRRVISPSEWLLARDLVTLIARDAAA